VDLLEAGTRWVWVVRLLGPRRVEVYEQGQQTQTRGPGSLLLAPGVLQNPVRVEALYDRTVAHEATLRNLLQRRGYAGVDEIRIEGRAEGKAEGKAEGRAAALLTVLDSRAIALSVASRQRIAATTDLMELEGWLRRSPTVASEEELFR